MQAHGRKRIVINLDQSQPAKAPAPGRRKWAKVLGLTGLVIVVLTGLGLAGVFVWWRHYQTTPPYSLALLLDAAQRNDSPLIEQILDVDKITINLGNQVAERAAGRYGTTLTPLLRKRVEALVPSLMPSVKRLVQQTVAQQVQELAEQADHKPFIAVAVGLPYFLEITTEGDRARALTTVRGRQIELALERSGERWRVTAIKDQMLVQRVVDEVIKDLPAIGHFE